MEYRTLARQSRLRGRREPIPLSISECKRRLNYLLVTEEDEHKEREKHKKDEDKTDYEIGLTPFGESRKIKGAKEFYVHALRWRNKEGSRALFIGTKAEQFCEEDKQRQTEERQQLESALGVSEANKKLADEFDYSIYDDEMKRETARKLIELTGKPPISDEESSPRREKKETQVPRRDGRS